MKKILLLLLILLTITLSGCTLDNDKLHRIYVSNKQIELQVKILKTEYIYEEDGYIARMVYMEYYKDYTFPPIYFEAYCEYGKTCEIKE